MTLHGLPSERVFPVEAAARLVEARATLSADAYRLYLLGLLAADARGAISKADERMFDALEDESIEVGWTESATETTVWARELSGDSDRVDGTRRVSSASAYKHRTS